jgi:hypothetical protein
MPDRFVHSILEANQAQAADGETVTDLPVNPLSVVFIHISPLNETSTIANFTTYAGLLTALDNIRIDYRGASVVDISAEDLAAYLWMGSRLRPCVSNAEETDNERRSLVLPVPLTKRVWDPKECFPAVKRGELQLTCTWDIAATGFDGLRWSIETLELLDAKPTHFQRMTTLSQTFAATGNSDVDMPIGNLIRGILAFGTTAFTGATPAPTIGALRLLKDNVEFGYASTDFEVSRAICGTTKHMPDVYLDHFHGVNAAGAAQEDTQPQQYSSPKQDNYTYLDYDPLLDDRYILETKDASRVHLRVNAEAAEAARFIPVEKVLVTDFLKN